MLGRLGATVAVSLAVLASLCEGFSPPCCFAAGKGATRCSTSSPSPFTVLRAETAGVADEYEEDFDAYGRDLDPKEARSQVDKENKEYAIVDRTALWMRAVRFPFRVVKKILPTKKTKPGKLILLRCGESTWNANQTFTGWADPDLTEKGIQECEHGAR